MIDQATSQCIPLKVYRTSDRLTIAAPMPGVEPRDIHVEVTQEQCLILRARLRGELKGIKEQLLNEWRAGDYYRALALPVCVDGELANVTYGNGILVVVLPVTKQTRPACMTLETIAPTHGEHARSAGHPIRPQTRRRGQPVLKV